MRNTIRLLQDTEEATGALDDEMLSALMKDTEYLRSLLEEKADQ